MQSNIARPVGIGSERERAMTESCSDRLVKPSDLNETLLWHASQICGPY